MKTKVYMYVKMDSREPLLLAEGVCRQLGIVSYHVEVKPGAPFEQVVKDPRVVGKGADSPSGTVAANDCRVPTVRMQLTQSEAAPECKHAW